MNLASCPPPPRALEHACPLLASEESHVGVPSTFLLLIRSVPNLKIPLTEHHPIFTGLILNLLLCLQEYCAKNNGTTHWKPMIRRCVDLLHKHENGGGTCFLLTCLLLQGMKLPHAFIWDRLWFTGSESLHCFAVERTVEEVFLNTVWSPSKVTLLSSKCAHLIRVRKCFYYAPNN